MKTTQEQEADQMARGTANRTNNNSFRIFIFPVTRPVWSVYLNDLHIVACHHELGVICHEVAGVPSLRCVVPPVLGMVVYPVCALLLESVHTATMVNLLTSIQSSEILYHYTNP